MNRSRYVFLAAIAVGLVVTSFLVRAIVRLVASDAAATVVSVPLLLGGGAIAVGLFVVGLLDLLGVYSPE